MHEKTKLKFSADGMSVQIIFTDGKESDSFSNAVDAIKALVAARKNDQITEEEVMVLLDTLAEHPTLPPGDTDSLMGTRVIRISVTTIPAGKRSSSGFLGLLSALLKA